MERVLEGAVEHGATMTRDRLQAVLPPSQMLISENARVRGFRLDGYGVFFDVEIPALRKSVMWTMRTLDRDAALTTSLDALRRIIESLPEGPSRLQGEQAFKRLQLQVGPMQQVSQPIPAPPGNAAAAAAEPAADQTADADPDVAYTESVKRALIDAMLDYSLPMDLQPDEWLTVAARDSEGPLVAGQLSDSMTILLRVKGSDLSTYAADRNKRDEVRKRVEVHVF
jgi:hypothetical protein